MNACGECGMPVAPREYHPYAACLMFKACRDSRTVRANLEAVVAHGEPVPDTPAPRDSAHVVGGDGTPQP